MSTAKNDDEPFVREPGYEYFELSKETCGPAACLEKYNPIFLVWSPCVFRNIESHNIGTWFRRKLEAPSLTSATLQTQFPDGESPSESMDKILANKPSAGDGWIEFKDRAPTNLQWVWLGSYNMICPTAHRYFADYFAPSFYTHWHPAPTPVHAPEPPSPPAVKSQEQADLEAVSKLYPDDREGEIQEWSTADVQAAYLAGLATGRKGAK